MTNIDGNAKGPCYRRNITLSTDLPDDWSSSPCKLTWSSDDNCNAAANTNTVSNRHQPAVASTRKETRRIVMVDGDGPTTTLLDAGDATQLRDIIVRMLNGAYIYWRESYENTEYDIIRMEHFTTTWPVTQEHQSC